MFRANIWDRFTIYYESKIMVYGSIMISSAKNFVYLSVSFAFGINYRQMNSVEGLAPVLRPVPLRQFVLFHNMLNDYFWCARTVHTSIHLMDRLEDQKRVPATWTCLAMVELYFSATLSWENSLHAIYYNI